MPQPLPDQHTQIKLWLEYVRSWKKKDPVTGEWTSEAKEPEKVRFDRYSPELRDWLGGMAYKSFRSKYESVAKESFDNFLGDSAIPKEEESEYIWNLVHTHISSFQRRQSILRPWRYIDHMLNGAKKVLKNPELARDLDGNLQDYEKKDAIHGNLYNPEDVCRKLTSSFQEMCENAGGNVARDFGRAKPDALKNAVSSDDENNAPLLNHAHRETTQVYAKISGIGKQRADDTITHIIDEATALERFFFVKTKAPVSLTDPIVLDWSGFKNSQLSLKQKQFKKGRFREAILEACKDCHDDASAASFSEYLILNLPTVAFSRLKTEFPDTAFLKLIERKLEIPAE